MDNFAEAIRAIRDMRRDGVISEYAIGGAMASIFWSEPTATYDLDVFVLMEQTGPLIDLGPIYEWAAKHGYPASAEHLVIAELPVQVIPAHNALTTEAVSSAAVLEYDGEQVRVIRPEYLIAMFLEPTARTRKRLERVATLLDEAELDRNLLNDVLDRYKLALPQR